MKKALLVIDMLNDFAKEGGALYSSRIEALIPKIEMMCEVFQKRGRIIFVCDAHDENDKEFKIFPPHAIKGSEGAKVVKELEKFITYYQPKDEKGEKSSVLDFIDELQRGKPLNVIEKRRYSAFFETILDRDRGDRVLPPYFADDEEVFVVGCCTDICVLYTVQDLANRNIPTTVIKSCVDTFDVPGHPADQINQIFFNHMEHILGAKVTEYYHYQM